VKDHTTRHDENMSRLSRIEGQVRGIKRMVEEGEYCIDIITQIQAARSALGSVAKIILKKHLNNCVRDAMSSGSQRQADAKIEELLAVLNRGLK